MIGGKKEELGKSNQSHWIMGTPFKSIPSLAVLPSSLGGGKMAFYSNPTSKADRAIAGGELMCGAQPEGLDRCRTGIRIRPCRGPSKVPRRRKCAVALHSIFNVWMVPYCPPFHSSNSNFNWKEVGSMTEEK